MSYTTDALDKFAQALEPTPAPPAPAPLPDPSRLAAAPALQHAPRGEEAARNASSPLGADAGSAAPRPAPAEKNQPGAANRDGITRKGPRGDWLRPVRVAVIVLAVALGFRFLVGVSARAAEAFLHPAVKKSSAGPQHAHPKPYTQKHASVNSRVPAKHPAARAHHRRRSGRRRVFSSRHHARG